MWGMCSATEPGTCSRTRSVTSDRSRMAESRGSPGAFDTAYRAASASAAPVAIAFGAERRRRGVSSTSAASTAADATLLRSTLIPVSFPQ